MKIRNHIPTLLICMTLFTIVLSVNYYVEFHIAGHFEGIYLLKDKGNNKLLVMDHLFVGHEKKMVFVRSFNNSYFNLPKRLFPNHFSPRAHLHVEWNRYDGSGYVSNYFPDGTNLVTYLGRYLDNDKEVHGLFVGGGLPDIVENSFNYNMNNSGMTYYENKKWYHIWCSVNEGIGSAINGTSITPSKWEFIGSGIESRTSDNVVLTSSHKTVIDEIPVRIDRKMHFTAREPYFTLEIKITNIGEENLFYDYLYGDEPWVGHYGTSLGEVGWVKNRIINYEEMIDTSRYSFIGMADIGNRVIGEKPVYTNVANFLEWFGPEKPRNAYFTNNLDHLPEAVNKVPLGSNERFLGLVWERWLAPEESATIRLAIGMAPYNPKTGVPEKPVTSWK